MSDAAVKEKPAAEAEREQTDGFNLIIDALKLNGLNTIYGVPGIPITDFGRMAQAAGIRVLSFRHGVYSTRYQEPGVAETLCRRPTVASLLREAGYHTVVVGKMPAT